MQVLEKPEPNAIPANMDATVCKTPSIKPVLLLVELVTVALLMVEDDDLDETFGIPFLVPIAPLDNLLLAMSSPQSLFCHQSDVFEGPR